MVAWKNLEGAPEMDYLYMRRRAGGGTRDRERSHPETGRACTLDEGRS